jgi:lipoprotein-anchoring transpeptidase ErfK/SrfK
MWIATNSPQSRCLGVTERRLILRRIGWLSAGAALIAASACNVNVNDTDQADQNATAQMSPEEQQRAQMREQGRAEFQDLRFVVDKSEREVRVFNGDQLLRTEQVTIGESDHETPTGSWQINQVDINPEWIPPDSEWAEDRERKAPGDPENPMGRARLLFDPPYTIHGTDDLESLGQAASHGSIRVANEVVLQLAEMVLKAGGAWEGDEWFRERINNRDREFQIRLENAVPIEVQE